jgi:dTDP-4-amino-4,6-dideoxygalactose transaminase
MSDFNASLGLSQFARLPSFISRRKELAKRFTHALTGSENTARSMFSRFIVVVEKKNFEAVAERFGRSGIEVKRPVFKPLYMLMGFGDRKFPNSRWAHDSIISVPIYPSMPEEDICRIEEFLEKNKNEMRCWPPA